jgi:hypothetical protein
MRILPMAVVLLATTALVAPSAPIAAQQTDEPFEFALFTPLQVRGESSAIQVFRLSLLYGSNVSVKGLDVGLVARNTGGESKGLQWALVGYVEGDFVGWQNGWLAGWVEGNITGLQGPAGVNHAGSGEVFQVGLVNTADDISGFQLGIVNFAENLYGLQIGLLNIIESKTSFSFLPIVNWSF